MIMGSSFKYEIGDRTITTGPSSGTAPCVIIRVATKEEYLEDMKMKDGLNHLPPDDVLDKAFFYEVSVD